MSPMMNVMPAEICLPFKTKRKRTVREDGPCDECHACRDLLTIQHKTKATLQEDGPYGECHACWDLLIIQSKTSASPPGGWALW